MTGNYQHERTNEMTYKAEHIFGSIWEVYVTIGKTTYGYKVQADSEADAIDYVKRFITNEYA